MEITERLSTALADRYRIERHLGAGGMATVYLAYDVKHDRKVAVKVLKPELAAVLGAERFVVEIKTTASLQHPHILPLFDSGTADGFLFYVMPFVEGETLREKLNRETQLGVDEAVKLAREVADALDYAHRHGVIHRDIKPENILLHDGRPVVADFGIALAVSAAAGGRMTETGLSLGTPYYMSPEQATGDKQITGRSDVYSLASVLYEMLTGEPPHMGNSAQQIIMKIIGDTPRPVTQLRKSVPANVAAAVAKALEKLPADRFDTAKAFAEALERPGSYVSTATAATTSVATPETALLARMPSWMAIGALVLAVVVGGAGWAMLAPEPVVRESRVGRFRLQLPDEAAPTGALGSTVALSPDGSRMVYVGTGKGRASLFSRDLGQLDPVAIPGTDGGTLPFFSRDGGWLGFRVGPRLVKIQTSGGPVMPIVTIPGNIYGAAWTSRDTITFATDSGIMEVPASGGSARMLARPDSARHEIFQWPEVLPGDKTTLFSIFSGGSARLAVLDRRTGTVTRLEQPGGYPRYVDAGYVMMSGLGGSIAAVPFDASRAAVTGPVITFAEANAGNDGDANLAVSRSGQVVYQPSGALVTLQLVLADRNGAIRDLGAPSGAYLDPRLSPDGRRVAVGTFNTTFTAAAAGESVIVASDIWVYDIGRRVRTRLTADTISTNPLWTQDGRRIVFSRIIQANRLNPALKLFSMPADGGTAPQLLFGAPGAWTPHAFVPGGRGIIAVGATHPDSNPSIWLFDGDSAAAPVNLIPGVGVKMNPTLSPDGRFIAYASNESGRFEVYVRALNSAESRRQVSSDGGGQPRWSPTGREIFFRAGPDGQQMMATEVRTQPSLEVGATTLLFEGPEGSFDVMPDGRSFLLLQPVESQEAALVVVLNWFDELRRTAGSVRR